MKRALISLLILASCLAGCRRDMGALSRLNTPESSPTLGITIDFPTDESFTKGEAGELPASSLENAIHSLMVWVFRSDNHSLVTTLDLTPEEFPVGGGVRRYSIAVGRDFANAKPDVDVFVLANAAAIGSSLDSESAWAELNDAFFANSEESPYYGFGISNPVHEVNPDLGLPMSGCGKNLVIRGEEPVFRVETVKLSRMVSRLRFIFCKTQTEGDEADEVSIQSIVLNGRMIPVREYVFTTGASGVVHDQEEFLWNYDELSYIVPGPDVIADNDTPENLIYVNQDPLTYEHLLDDAIAHNQLTDLGYTYFRESDRRLVGRIYYTVNGNQRTREFNMAAEGDFARNHTWTVFGYFLSGRNLQVSLSVMPWDYNVYFVDFSEESVNVSSKFVVDENTVELEETSKDHYDAHLLPGMAAKGRLHITTPVGGRLMIRPVGDANAFKVEPDMAFIAPSENAGRIDIMVRRNPDLDEDLTGKYITLSFSVEVGERVIDANTEVIDKVYRFVL